MAYNNATDNMRQNLTLAVTIDGGDTWQRVAVIETNTSYSPPSGKFSYPALLCDNSTVSLPGPAQLERWSNKKANVLRAREVCSKEHVARV